LSSCEIGKCDCHSAKTLVFMCACMCVYV
jgi:hypothetical protein